MTQEPWEDEEEELEPEREGRSWGPLLFKVGGLLMALIFVGSIVLMMLGPFLPSAPATGPGTAGSTELSDYTTWLRRQVEEATGALSNRGLPRLVDIQFGGSQEQPILALLADVNAVPDLALRKMQQDSLLLFRRLLADQRVSEATLFWLYPLEGSQATRENRWVLVVGMTNSTAASLEWNTLAPGDLSRVADVYEEVVGFREAPEQGLPAS